MDQTERRWLVCLTTVCVLLLPVVNAGCLPERQSKFQNPAIVSYAEIVPDMRDLCPETPETRPPNRVDTATEVANFRAWMTSNNLDAFIIYNGDQHMSLTDHDARVKYISGFSGSNGFVVITHDKAALWTDGRYTLQGDQQMDCSWLLMKSEDRTYPSAADWLVLELEAGDTVGAMPQIMSASTWTTFDQQLAYSNITLEQIEVDPMDTLWTDDRPDIVNNAIYVHEFAFTGETWQEKVARVREAVAGAQADAIILAALDDIAWLYNLRGSDKTTSPLFDSFVFLAADSMTLYLRNLTKQLSSDVRKHLDVDVDGNCNKPENTSACIKVVEYDSFLHELEQLTSGDQYATYWISPTTNYAIYSLTENKQYSERSPIQLMKSIKNPTEKIHYRQCQIRDSAVVAEMGALLEKEVPTSSSWTEMGASNKVTELRSQDPYFHMVSFTPIAGSGPNGAVIHYRATEETDRTLTTNELFLFDTGGNYLDGTTDVTRTWHFGTPTDDEKEAYTRVLLGVIDLATAVWPAGLYGSDIDALTRTPIWANGWDYNHGTGHGIGYFLNVHEGPGRIRLGYNPDHAPLYAGMYFSDGPASIGMGYYSFLKPLYPGMFFSDEPGFYEDGKFGVRLETIVEIVEVDTKHNFDGKTFLGFNPVTLVPFEPKLIKYDMLDAKHRRWLNEYHKRCVDETGEYLKKAGKMDAYNWILARADPVADVPIWDYSNSASTLSCSLMMALGATILALQSLLS